MEVKIKSLLVAASLLFAVAVNGQTVQQGLAQLDGDQPNKAKATFTSLVAASNTGENLYYLGYAHLRAGEFDEAKATFEKGLAAEPKQPLNAVGLATLLLAKKDGAGAKTAFDKILADTKMKNAEVMFRIAEAYTLYEETNDPGEAVRLIDLITEKTKKPLTADMQIVKGDAFLLKNDGGPAASAYEQSILINKTAKAYVRLGVVYLRGKNYQYTVNNYQSAYETDSSFAPYYKRMGEYYIIFNRYKESSKFFRKYVERAEATPAILLSTAKLLFLAKDYEGAMQFTTQAEAGGAKDNDIFRMKGYSNIELGNPQLGIENLEQMVKAGVKPYYLDNVYFGKGYQGLKQDSLAIEYFLKAAPEDTINNHYGSIYTIVYGQKKYAKAADYALKSIEWKQKKKAPMASADFYNAAMALYFTTAYTPREDTLARYNIGMKADTMFANAIAINDKFAPFYLFRARTNNYVDYTGTKWLAVPHYDKFLGIADPAKANKEQLYEAYRYLVGYHANVTKDTTKIQEFVDKAVAIKPEDPDKLKEFLAPTTPATSAATTPAKTPKK
ncbi:tetratricopeptide repeat protein [Arcicella rosea]|uniref:Tetratricopeptide (TPR) repeat protein n=1 Tax=Arcicella rosea TaxID=502909 RepID=A0A841EP91_9BACT|nr:tetratricopeptide repeat protein [Arcicella rosea]MBB6005592.1 tetratricopeptide (TPR) repeat protein [Arcicella rosea]